MALDRGNEQPKEHSMRVTQNFAFLQGVDRGRKGELVPVCKGLAKLVVVDIVAQPRPGQPATNLREHELNRPRA